MRTAIENLQSYTEFVLKILLDVRYHIGLGGCGQA